MLHYETVMRLHKAKEETRLIGIIISTVRGGYGYGYIHIENGNYEANKYPRNFKKSVFLSKEFQNEIENMNLNEECADSEWESIEKAVNNVIGYFVESDKGIGEFTDLKNIEEIMDYLEKKKLKYLIFKEDGVWNNN